MLPKLLNGYFYPAIIQACLFNTDAMLKVWKNISVSSGKDSSGLLHISDTSNLPKLAFQPVSADPIALCVALYPVTSITPHIIP